MAVKSDKKNDMDGSFDDLEQYGVWVKAGPETVKEESSARDDFDLADLSDVNTEITAEEEDLLGSLEENSREESGTESLGDFDDFSFDSPAETESSGAAADDFSFPDVEDAREDDVSEAAETAEEDDASDEDFSLPEEESLEDGDIAADAETLDLDFNLGEPADGEESFNDIAAVENEMTDSPVTEDALDAADIPEEEPEESVPAAAAPAAEISAAGAGILLKIEEELASIKAELFDLKKELSNLRAPGIVPPEGAEDHHKAAGADSGFFADDEDEDETIALTGDELDNILSTADITEETGKSDILPDDILGFSEEAPSASKESAAPEVVTIDDDAFKTGAAGEDIIPDSDETEAASEDIDLNLGEPEASEDISLDLGFDETDEPLSEADDSGFEVPSSEDEIVIDMTDSETESQAESFENSNIISLDDTPAVTETIPLTTPEEQAIIEEYNRELDNFGSEDLGRPEEISETLGGEETEKEETDIEFDLDSLQDQSEAVEAAVFDEAEGGEAAPAVFEEELAEIEEPETAAREEVPAAAQPEKKAESTTHDGLGMSLSIREEIKAVLKYMDQLLESLPEDKIQEFAHSEHFDVYRKLFEELGLE